MRALFQVDQVQPKAVLVLLLLAPVLLSSCKNFDYSFPEIADDAKPRHVYYKAGECESPFVATLPTDNTDYLRLDTPTLKATPTCEDTARGLTKSFSHWDITYSNSNGEHKPGDKIPFTRHGKYFNATAIWECMRETYDLAGGTGEIVPACKDPNQTYTLSDGKDKAGNFVFKKGYHLAGWQKDGTGVTLALSSSGGTTPSDDSKPMPKFKAVWEPVRVTVNFDGGGQAFQSPPSSVTKNYEESVAIPDANAAKTNYYTLKTSDSWQASGGTYFNAGSQAVTSLWSYTNWATNSNASTAEVTLTAQWTAKPVTVTYNGNANTGGSMSNTSETYGSPEKNLDSNDFTKQGYTFDDWYKEAAGTNKITNGITVNESNFVLTNTNGSPLETTVYAKWKPIPVTAIKIVRDNGDAVPSDGLYLEKGSSVKLKANITVPTGAVADKNIEWSGSGCSFSPSTTVAGIAVTVTANGNCTVTAKARNQGSSSFQNVTATTKIVVSEYKIADEIKPVLTTAGFSAKFPIGLNDAMNGDSPAYKFSMGKTEVVYTLWYKVKAWATEGSCNNSTGQGCYTFANKGQAGSGPEGLSPNTTDLINQMYLTHPVTKVSWRDAIVWCNAFTEWYNAVKGNSLSVVYKKNGILRDSRDANANNVDNAVQTANATGFRLPTSIEWEFAARYRTDTTNCVMDGTSCASITNGVTYYFTKGNSASGATADYNNAVATKAVAWYDVNSGGSTHKGGKLDPNALGIYDMSGNVYEWCFDANANGSKRVRLGASWTSIAWVLQVGNVGYDLQDHTDNNLGFRVARSLP